MSENLDFYNSLELTLLKAENLISDGVNNSKSLFHTPVLSTFINNTISTRTVVLREFNAKKRILRFHTDSRSGKIEELKENSISSIHGYDPELKVQVRLKGKPLFTSMMKFLKRLGLNLERCQKCAIQSKTLLGKKYLRRSLSI